MLLDISPRIRPGMPVWPGDVPYRLDRTASFAAGANLDLGAVHTTLHVGAHTDAPSHYRAGAPAIADVDLTPYYGPCQVVDVDATRGERFRWDDLRQEPTAPRILLKTGTFPDPYAWNDDFAAPEPGLIDRLGERGTVLVGFDTPSTDLFDSKGLEAHQALLSHGMANLEGLVLAHVPSGHYTLCAFPLALEGADASPVRAVLVTV